MAGLLALFHSLTSIPQWAGILLSVSGSLFGVVLSLVGYNALRREGEYFWDARERRAAVYKLLHEKMAQQDKEQLELDKWDIISNKPPNKPICEIISTARKCIVGAFRKTKNQSDTTELGIRDGFQIILLCASVLFCAYLVISLIYVTQSS